MSKKEFVIDDEFRMKVINFLKIYGYYDGILVRDGNDKKYVSGEILITDLIQNKKDYKELKQSINKVLEYCYENRFDEIEGIMNYFYQVECKPLLKSYGSLFDKIS